MAYIPNLETTTPSANPRFAFTTELRDTGHFGFELPKDQIIPSGEVSFNSRSMSQSLLNLAIVCIVIILTQYGNSDDQFGNPQAVFLIQSNFRRCGLDLKSSLIGFSRLLLRKRQRIIFKKLFLLKINSFLANVN